jgi:hypothetical protein
MQVRGVALPATIIGPTVLVTGAGVEKTCIPTIQKKMRKHSIIKKKCHGRKRMILTDNYLSHHSQPIYNSQLEMNNCEPLQYQAYQPKDCQEK